MNEQTFAPEVGCHDVSRSFDGEFVLYGLNLTVAAGEITTLVGASGSGKSTLVKHILGLRAPDHGTVAIGACDVWDCSPERLLRVRKGLSALHSGSTLYDGSIHASVSIRDNLRGTLFEYHVNPAAAEGRAQPSPVANPYLGLWAPQRSTRVTDADDAINQGAAECLDRFDLTTVAERFPDEVAARTRRRAALACSLAVDVPLYVLDDLDGALDAVNRARVIDALIDVHRRTGATMLITTHDLALAEASSDSVAVLAGGRIVDHGEPGRVLDGVEAWYELDEQLRVAGLVGSPRIRDHLPDGPGDVPLRGGAPRLSRSRSG